MKPQLLISTLVLLCLSPGLFSARGQGQPAQTSTSVLTWGGPGNDRAADIAVDTWGSVYVTGHFSGTADLDPGPGVQEFTSGGPNDIYLAKLDPTGELEWIRAWGGDGPEKSGGVAVDGSGNVYVIGSFSGKADFDPGAGAEFHTGHFFLSRFDSCGAFQWTRTWGSGDLDEAVDLAVDSEGNIYVTGRFSDTVDLDPGFHIDEHEAQGFVDVFLSKFDSEGKLLWARTWGGPGWDAAESVATDNKGNAYVCGSFVATVDFDPGLEADEHSTGRQNATNAFLSKFDPGGEHLWARTWGGTATTFGRGVAVGPSGNVFAGGDFVGTADFDPGPGSNTGTSNGSFDVFLSEFSSEGEYAWTRTWGGTDTDGSFRLAVNDAGAVLIAGGFSGEADFDPGPGVEIRDAGRNWGAFVSRFDPAGEFQGVTTLSGESGAATAYAAAIVGAEEICLVGRFAGAVDFNPGIGVDRLDSEGRFDAFLVRSGEPRTESDQGETGP